MFSLILCFVILVTCEQEWVRDDYLKARRPIEGQEVSLPPTVFRPVVSRESWSPALLSSLLPLTGAEPA